MMVDFRDKITKIGKVFLHLLNNTYQIKVRNVCSASALQTRRNKNTLKYILSNLHFEQLLVDC